MIFKILKILKLKFQQGVELLIK